LDNFFVFGHNWWKKIVYENIRIRCGIVVTSNFVELYSLKSTVFLTLKGFLVFIEVITKNKTKFHSLRIFPNIMPILFVWKHPCFIYFILFLENICVYNISNNMKKHDLWLKTT